MSNQVCSKSSYSWKNLKDLRPPQYFPVTLKLLTMCLKHDFPNTLLKEPNGFSQNVKFLINYPGQKLPQYGRKNLATTIFFKQRIKEKVKKRFDCYFWECCLWCFVANSRVFYLKFH